MSSEGTSFYSQGEDAISRQIDIQDNTRLVLDPGSPEFDEYYDIEWTIEQIQKDDYKRIALQFPDHLLRDSVPIFQRLRSRLGAKRDVYILADTSYGSCCVDEVAAQHVDADVIVHYDHACMSHPCRLPVLYVFGREQLEVTDCVQKFLDIIPKSNGKEGSIVLSHDVAYAHYGGELESAFRQHLRNRGLELIYSPIPRRLDPVSQTVPISSERGADQTSEAATILFIGRESLHLTNMLMTHSSSQIYRYDPGTKSVILESTRTNKMLMRRYTAVQKARDADVFGILVGTLGVASYLPLISHIRILLNRAQKKSYTISVGKLTPAKLANFMEVECFVLVACPENSVIESKEFFRPIITPFELQVSLQSEPSWTGRYVLDFGEILSDPTKYAYDGSNGDDPDQPIFSLMTGKYRHAKRYGAQNTDEPAQGDSMSMILRNQDSTLTRLDGSAAADFLHGRSYKGLDVRLGEDAPSILEQGRAGLARGYQDDHPEAEDRTPETDRPS